jgi:cyclopropane-fatty-acyl-phospholipid synthase
MAGAEQYGVDATGITLSRNQHDFVRAEIARRGLAASVKVEFLDYERLPPDAQYDKIASVGMFEHVGKRRLVRYFDCIYRALKPGGWS